MLYGLVWIPNCILTYNWLAFSNMILSHFTVKENGPKTIKDYNNLWYLLCLALELIIHHGHGVFVELVYLKPYNSQSSLLAISFRFTFKISKLLYIFFINLLIYKINSWTNSDDFFRFIHLELSFKSMDAIIKNSRLFLLLN
jgi:hypothetical protein